MSSNPSIRRTLIPGETHFRPEKKENTIRPILKNNLERVESTDFPNRFKKIPKKTIRRTRKDEGKEKSHFVRELFSRGWPGDFTSQYTGWVYGVDITEISHGKVLLGCIISRACSGSFSTNVRSRNGNLMNGSR